MTRCTDNPTPRFSYRLFLSSIPSPVLASPNMPTRGRIVAEAGSSLLEFSGWLCACVALALLEVVAGRTLRSGGAEFDAIKVGEPCASAGSFPSATRIGVSSHAFSRGMSALVIVFAI